MVVRMMRCVPRAGVLAVAASLALTSCGGGGSDEGDVPQAGSAPPATGAIPPAAPALPPAPSAPTPAPAIWHPAVDATWQWQLRGDIDTDYDVDAYDIDLFDAPQAVIDDLHRRGRRVICYFSAGSSEDFRTDFGEFDAADKGRALDDWPGERWLDVRSGNVRRIMRVRLDLAASKRCDGVEPDNVDGYANSTGFPLTAADQLDYDRFLAREAHVRGLAVGLKNDLDQVEDLVGSFDFAVNEQCHEFAECDRVAPFVLAGKPVFNAEYDADFVSDREGRRGQLCAAAAKERVKTLVLPLELDDSFRYTCG
ncbi:endo alpha-1,4 polygalactosaminidase [Sphingomonas sp. BK580]|uniref:endo alpha-1,4 polygalactosaminidase n=1 Tax=Sphingomonas sp. BK580 TaxID=2586972 RepID=UPI00160E2C0F|nr:endo alpha-1,4 polygalactosaminidase [Sphingomonas sp. BK580]